MSLAVRYALRLQAAVMLSASSPCIGARQECSTARKEKHAREERLGPGIPCMMGATQGYLHAEIT